jgi:hypothetical protein
METTDSNRFHTLKKRILTRWNTILIVLRSYASNISGIEVVLRRMKHYDLILSIAENQIVNDLIEFLALLESTTTILSASKSYPTMSLYLLLRMVSFERKPAINVGDYSIKRYLQKARVHVFFSE